MKALSIFLLALFAVGSAAAQFAAPFANYRPAGLAGIGVFEPTKEAALPFDRIRINVGGDFAIQFQGLDQTNDAGNLVELTDNVTLPTANLNLDVLLARGMRMHLRTYLSSRHHNEAWVKGGYFQIDNLDVIQEGFLADVMDVTRLRFGMDEINYGDAHFRRSDNANAAYNPFVGNFIMDSFTTEPFAEVSVFSNGFLGVAGFSNGRLNQSPLPGDDGYVLYGKAGVDREVADDVRVRLTGSVYRSSDKSTRDYLYGGDRSGERYHNVLEMIDEERPSDFLPRYNPGFPHQTAFQVNPFVKAHGVEFFGIIERANGGNDGAGGFTHLGGELLYRFGAGERFYVGGRYNTVTGEKATDGPRCEITRLNVAGGWFLTPNVLSKLEYVTSNYDGEGFTGKFAGAEFNGFVVEAVITF